MRPGSIAVAAAALLVAAIGVYLYLSLGDATAPETPEQALAAARAESSNAAARAATTATPEKARERDRARPGQPQKRPPHVTDVDGPGVLSPQVDFKKRLDGAALSPDVASKYRNDDPKVYEPDPAHEENLLEANKLYDKGDFEGARGLATKMLSKVPGNVRMLRVVVSSSCIMGEADVAKQYAVQLPAPDLEAMKARCSKFQIDL